MFCRSHFCVSDSVLEPIAHERLSAGCTGGARRHACGCVRTPLKISPRRWRRFRLREYARGRGCPDAACHTAIQPNSRRRCRAGQCCSHWTFRQVRAVTSQSPANAPCPVAFFQTRLRHLCALGFLMVFFSVCDGRLATIKRSQQVLVLGWAAPFWCEATQ